MPPFAIIGIFIREEGGGTGGTPPWNDDCQSVPDLTEKSPLFQTPQKAAPSDPGIAFSRICVDLGELFEVIWWLFFTKNKNGKSVFGLRRRVRIACPTFQKTTLF